MNEAYLCDGVRTPIGRYGGALATVRTDDLAAVALKALVTRQPGVDWAAVDDVYLGCANQAGEDNRNVARMAVLLAGLPEAVPAATVNRLCGSSLDAVALCARAIRAGEADLMIAGGVEGMTRAPFVMPKADSAFSRNNAVYDTTLGWRFVNPEFRQRFGIDSMPETAENVAAEFGIARTDQDAFALRSQQRYAAAKSRGFFDGEIVPVTVRGRKGDTVVADDEHPRATTLEALGQLKGVVRPDGTVTAGNASGINDGAVALLTSESQWRYAEAAGARRRRDGARRASWESDQRQPKNAAALQARVRDITSSNSTRHSPPRRWR
jgi:acetyl-CoA acetyltransferase family protein